MSKVESILKELKDLTLVEASELVKAIEEEFDVSAVAAPVAMAAGPVAGGETAVVEEKSEFTVKVTEVPADKKIAVIKAVKNILNIGLAEAKSKVESAPFVVAENVKKEDAEQYKTDLSGAGATVAME
ncbi:50S ribosomal protein L7/L12 [Candidatus Gracilibacteria bacterium]|nr:50S ribosomal protein L7/L12 [Candidatus Gracilibacteria bacterium]